LLTTRTSKSTSLLPAVERVKSRAPRGYGGRGGLGVETRRERWRRRGWVTQRRRHLRSKAALQIDVRALDVSEATSTTTLLA
jgi:hypothetical protein